MTYDLRQNFVSAQYLEDKLTEIKPNFKLEFILTSSSLGLLHVISHWTRASLGLLHNITHTFVPKLWPLIYVKISFPLNTLRTN